MLAMMILLQPVISIAFFPFLGSVVHAEEADSEDKDKPRPGVNNADNTGQRVPSGKDFPSGGNGNVPVYGPGSGSNGGGGSEVITDPTNNLTPSRPNLGNGNRGGNLPENPHGVGGNTPGGGNGAGGNGSDGDGSGNGTKGNGSGGDGSGNGPEGNTPDGAKGNLDHDPNEATGGDDSSKGDGTGSGEQGAGHDYPGNKGNSNPENGDRNGTDSGYAGEESKSPIDIIKKNIKDVKDNVTLIDLLNKLAEGKELSNSDWMFIAGQLEISDNPDVQKGYETLLSQISSANGVASEIKDTHAIRYAERGKLTFKDWFKISTYKDTFIGHTVDSVTDYAYRTIYGEDKLALVKEADKNKFKLSTPFTWLGEKISGGLKAVTEFSSNIGSKIVSTIERGINFLGKGISSIADGAKTLLSKGTDGLAALKETVGNAISNAKTSFGKSLLNGVNGIVAAADRGLSSLGGIADKFGKAGQWLANSSFGKSVTSVMTNVKNFGSNMLQSGKDLVSKISNSKVMGVLKSVANSPLGKLGSGALSGLSIWSGATDLTGDGPWNVKVSGGLSIASGALGIAGLIAAGTAAAPILVGGAFVAGVAALGFTYGPKLVNAWNESKFGSSVNNAVKNTVSAVGDAVKSVGSSIKKGASNLVSSISSGLSGLFGR